MKKKKTKTAPKKKSARFVDDDLAYSRKSRKEEPVMDDEELATESVEELGLQEFEKREDIDGYEDDN